MMAVVTSPIDVVKTRIMNQKSVLLDSTHSDLPYKGAIDCLFRTVKAEGLLGLYKGFLPNALRLGPHTLLSFVVYEQLRKQFGIKPM